MNQGDRIAWGEAYMRSHTIFDTITSLENLTLAWNEFKRGKQKRLDVQTFGFSLEDELFKLHHDLLDGQYRHAPYTQFYITDPKLRHIHKAVVRDRVLHQAVFRVLGPIFERSFIFDSYSCRIGKGTHRGVLRLDHFARRLSRNNRHNIFSLKCDIEKFFDSVDHRILFGLFRKKISDHRVLVLVKSLIDSYQKGEEKGLPLGNVTSQLFANIYLNELDQYLKHVLGLQYYLRYCDDFVIFADESKQIPVLLSQIRCFLAEHLLLTLHPRKVIVRTYRQGIDFLGYVVRPWSYTLRTRTKKRILRKVAKAKGEFVEGVINQGSFDQSLQSYFGVLSHCKGFKIKEQISRLIE